MTDKKIKIQLTTKETAAIVRGEVVTFKDDLGNEITITPWRPANSSCHHEYRQSSLLGFKCVHCGKLSGPTNEGDKNG